jgi:two-component system sensor histidine kinase ChiS
MRSFTTLSETMTPQENFAFINAYLQRVSPIIRKHHGLIDKYIGDAIMALFPRCADDAVQAAIEMNQAVARYNVERTAEGYQAIQIGIGLHTGSVMLGTVGEAERMQGTVISDAVNVAARLEGLTKAYGASLLISEQTLQALATPSRYHYRFVDRVQVKGKHIAISVLEIFDSNPPHTMQRQLQTRETFEAGLQLYHAQHFAEASVKFNQVLEENADDKAARLYLQRSAYFMVHGVPPDWQGIGAVPET